MQAIIDEPLGFDIPEPEEYQDETQIAAYKLLRDNKWKLVMDYWNGRKEYYNASLLEVAANETDDDKVGRAYRNKAVIDAEIDNFLNFMESLNEQQEKVVRKRAKRS